jgi:putative redox protein
MPKVRLKWIEELKFLAEDEHDHSLVLDPGMEGQNGVGIRPMLLVLMGLGGCMGGDIVSILKKKRVDLAGFEIVVEGERAEEHPKRWTKLVMRITAKGEVPREALGRAFELSRDKYCSVFATIKNPPEVSFEVGVEA